MVYRGIAGIIDGFAIIFQPISYFIQNLGHFRFYDAFGGRTYAQQQTPALGHHLYQRGNDDIRTFENGTWHKAPILAQRHAGLPRVRQLFLGNHLLGCAVVLVLTGHSTVHDD